MSGEAGQNVVASCCLCLCVCATYNDLESHALSYLSPYLCCQQWTRPFLPPTFFCFCIRAHRVMIGYSHAWAGTVRPVAVHSISGLVAPAIDEFNYGYIIGSGSSAR